MDILRAGSGFPLVLIGGLQGHLLWQLPVVEALSSYFTVYSYSLRGEHPWEDPHGADYRLLVDDLNVLLPRYQIEKPLLCGISMGGAVAWHYGQAYPERLSGLILTNTFLEHRYLSPGLHRLYHFVRRLPLNEQYVPFIAMLVTGLFLAPELWRERKQWRTIRFLQQTLLSFRRPPRVSSRRLAMIGREALRKRLDMPVLVIAGGKDKLVPTPMCREFGHYLSQSHFIEFPHWGHLGPYFHPEEFARTIRDWHSRN